MTNTRLLALLKKAPCPEGSLANMLPLWDWYCAKGIVLLNGAAYDPDIISDAIEYLERQIKIEKCKMPAKYRRHASDWSDEFKCAGCPAEYLVEGQLADEGGRWV